MAANELDLKNYKSPETAVKIRDEWIDTLQDDTMWSADVSEDHILGLSTIPESLSQRLPVNFQQRNWLKFQQFP